MKHAIENGGRYLGGMVAALALGALASAQGHVRAHSGLYSLEGDVLMSPTRGPELADGGTILVDNTPAELVLGFEFELLAGIDPRGIHSPGDFARRAVLTGGTPGSAAALHVGRRVLYTSEIRPVGGIVLRGVFDRRGVFVAEIPTGIGELAVQGAALEARRATRTLELDLALEAALVRGRGARLAGPVRVSEVELDTSSTLTLPRRRVLSR